MSSSSSTNVSSIARDKRFTDANQSPPILLWRRGLHPKLKNIPFATDLSRCI
jgi:hypothetical protein